MSKLEKSCPFIVNRCKLRFIVASWARELRRVETKHITQREKNQVIRSYMRSEAIRCWTMRAW